ncbi:ATP-binding protein [Saccharospirillum salsuginis]|uniref:histidine kinase n=1 Tax=Saccharospirillum salsuginis TaxID=418750 RepID=A0A918K6D0_9GAMM|nr:ATP-binding protein [Saccharospirillum salsuginis]GGX49228.1 two-component sensor histidine kinase [Saccharospirillum salsuginis]
MRIKLRYKLFLVILLANTLLTTAIVIANNRAFSTGFTAYLNEVQSRRLAPLLEGLAEAYADQDGWQWIGQQPERWRRIIDRNVYGDRLRGRPPEAERDRDPPSPPPIQLKDARGHYVLGDDRGNGPMIWLPIEWQGKVVGELGVPQSLRLTAQFDRLFADQQRRQLRWIALVSLALSAAVAIPFASRLVRPISRLKTATHRLTSGDYEVQLPTDGGDELADLARDFNTLSGTLAQNLSARQRWISDISHELRTPISVLRAELEALQDGIRQPDAETLQSLHQEIERLGGLVEDLYELSLSDAGALSYRKEAVDLNDIIAEVRGHFQSALEQGCFQVRIHAGDSPALIQGDRNRLIQLFTNLMQNSLSYTDSSAEAPGILDIDVTQDARSTRILWSDSAPGVPEAALPRLFERLYRVEGSRNRATGGSGLGLAIVHNVVDAHQGHIEAKPSSLGGLTLEIRFPSGRSA